MEALTSMLPQEINTSKDINYTSMMIQINFILGYFNLLSGLVASSLAFAPVFIKRAIFFNEDALSLALKYLAASLWQCMNLWGIHMVITKVGMIYVEAEVLRLGNDQTLDNLSEGVIILKSSDLSLQFQNKAARDVKKRHSASLTSSLIENSNKANTIHDNETA